MRAVPEHGRLEPFFRASRWVMAAIVLVLAGYAIVAAPSVASAVPAAVLLVLVICGAALLQRLPTGARLVGLVVVLAVWAIAAAVDQAAVYLAFPFFFVVMALVPGWAGAVVVALVAAWAIAVTAMVQPAAALGAALGIAIAAAVAVLLSTFVHTLEREAHARERLIVQLRDTRAALTEAERGAAALAERERVARDIHDTVSQSLASVGMLLHAADAAAAAGDDPRPRIAQAREASAHALADTRGLIAELARGERAQGSLVDAIRRLVDDAAATAGLEADVRTSGDVDALSTRLEVIALRIVQGAVSNVVRHAEATTLSVVLAAGEGLRIEVHDDGHGFDPSAVAGSFGLRTMRARAEEAGGTMTLDTGPAGTTVTVTLPEKS